MFDYFCLLDVIFSFSINLRIIFLIKQLIVLSIKGQKIVKNVFYNFQQSKPTSSDVLFCLTSPKLKDIKFTKMYDKEKQVFTFEELKPVNI